MSKNLTEVLILMATYNGERFLAEQLDSIARQNHTDWQLWISDDTSSDQSISLITDFMYRHPEGQVRLFSGPNMGATENFRSLIRRADLQGRPLAFCDQDDVWDFDHLSRGLSALTQVPNSLVAYGCRMRFCDTNLNHIGSSPRPARPLGFRNALIQNMISGNTMILTPEAAELVQQAEVEAGFIPVHDWWVYQLITGAGGMAILDDRLGISYRQHDRNVIGSGRGIRTVPSRMYRYIRGCHKQWAKQNSDALMASVARLTPENRSVLMYFSEALTASLLKKISLLRRSGVYLQSPQARLAFWLSVIANKF